MFSSRQEQIIRILSEEGEKSVEHFMAQFDVSDMTIRRDLTALESGGIITRTWGGARINESSAIDFTFKERVRQQHDQKRRIGTQAAAMVRSGDFVFLDTGSTTVHVARSLKEMTNITVCTCSFPIITELFNASNVNLVMLGGTVNRSSMELYGPFTEKNFNLVKSDVAFLGIDAFGPQGQLLTSSIESARVSELIIEHSVKKVVVADSSKWAADAPVQYGDLSMINAIITDNGLPLEQQNKIRQKGIELILV